LAQHFSLHRWPHAQAVSDTAPAAKFRANCPKRAEPATDFGLFLHSHFLISEIAESAGVGFMLKTRFR
jgi:hypothetical protein